MPTLAELNVIIGADIDGFDKQVQTLEKGIGKLGDKLQSAGSAMTTYLTAPLLLMGGASLKAAGDLQALTKGFAATYKGAGDVNAELAKTKEVAKLPGLGLKEAIQGATNLQAVGFEAAKSREILMGYGNALATVGKGKADLEGVITALSQMSSKGKISAEEINQIAERVPQIRKVMQDAFGTADTTALQKMGISVDEFVSKTTAELNKLPKVTGGINNAFENMGDAGFLALSKIGDALNKAFDIEGTMNAIGDALSAAAEKFGSLDPAVQKTIFVVAGLAAAAGPLLLAIGGIVSALPLLTAGFAVMTGPVGIAIAAIAAGAALIISNWDALKAYFTSGPGGKIFNGLRESVTKAIDAVTRVFSIFLSDAKIIWNGLSGIIGSAFSTGLAVAGSVLGGALDAFSTVVGVFADVFQGNWQGVWDGVRNIFVIAVNTLTKVLTGLAAGAVRTVGAIAGAFGKDLGTEKAALAIERFGKSLELPLFGTREWTTANGSLAKSLAELTTATTTSPQSKKGGMGKEAADALAALNKELVLNGKYAIALGASYDMLDERSGILTSGIQKLVAAGFGPASATVRKFRAELDLVNATLAAPKEPLISLSAFDNLWPSLEKLKAGIDAVKHKTAEMSTGGAAYIDSFTQASIDGFSAQTAALQNLATNGLVFLGDTLGQVFSGNFQGMQAFFGGILDLLSGFLKQLGEACIAVGIAGLSLKKAFANPGAAIAAGVALIALSGIAAGIMKKGPGGGGGATGGGGKAPTYQSPSKTASYGAIGNAEGSKVEFVISGTNLVGVLSKEQKQMVRRG